MPVHKSDSAITGRGAKPGINYQRLYAYRFRDVDQVRLSHIAVEEHLYAAGFEVTAVHPRFLPYSFRGLLPPLPTLTRMYLHTSLAWKLLGKQFLVIARKP
jgi:hypothetical protein